MIGPARFKLQNLACCESRPRLSAPHSYWTVASTSQQLFQSQGVKIQFCPYDEADAELNTFCVRFNLSMEVASFLELTIQFY